MRESTQVYLGVLVAVSVFLFVAVGIVLLVFAVFVDYYNLY